MKYTSIKQAEQMIERNEGKIGGKVIEADKPGLKVIGAISFLVNHHGYMWAGHQFGKM